MKKIIGAGWMLDGIHPQAYRDWGLCMEGEKIIDIGPAARLREKYKKAEYSFQKQWLLIPGCIDAHDHGRGLSPFWFGARDQSLELWIPRLGQAGAPPRESALYDGLLLASSGVTTVIHCHNTGNWQRAEEELAETVRGYREAGVRVVLCPPYTDQNSLIYWERERFLKSLDESTRQEFLSMVCDQPVSLNEYFQLIERLRIRLGPELEAGTVKLQLHPVGGQWCSDEALLQIKEYALAHAMRIHMHLLETKYQMLYAKKRWGKSMVAHLQEIGFLGPWLTCAHMVWIDEEDLKVLKNTGVCLVHNPSSNLRLRSGVMPLRKVLDWEIPCGIGLDGCGYDDDQDYTRELRTAAVNCRETGVQDTVTAEEIFKMAMEGGRKAVGAEDLRGCLVSGGNADFVCVDYGKLCFPYADSGLSPQEILVHKGSRDTTAAVYCQGKLLMSDGPAQKARLAKAGQELADAISSSGTQAQKSVSRKLIQEMKTFYEGWERRQNR